MVILAIQGQAVVLSSTGDRQCWSGVLASLSRTAIISASSCPVIDLLSLLSPMSRTGRDEATILSKFLYLERSCHETCRDRIRVLPVDERFGVRRTIGLSL